MTAYGSSDVQKEANRRGSLYYIEKPFEISDIRRIIIDLIGGRRISRKSLRCSTGRYHPDELLGTIDHRIDHHSDGEKGIIYFNEGEVIHAECGDDKGWRRSIESWAGRKESLFPISVLCLPCRPFTRIGTPPFRSHASKRRKERMISRRGLRKRLGTTMDVVITRNDLERIDSCLGNMISSSLADAVLLIDRSAS